MTAIDTQPGQAAIGGIETNGTGISGADTGSGQGAYGSSNLGIGVAGISNERDGGWTIPSGSFGVYGTSILGNGVYGITSASAYSGVAGINSGAGNGVYGDSSTGTGVQGITGSGSYSDGSYPFTG